VTIARNAPLLEAGWRHTIMISEKKKDIFFAEGPDSTNRVEKIYEISLCAHPDFASDKAVLHVDRTERRNRRMGGAKRYPSSLGMIS
jgi:hypothetical protein